MNEKGKKLSEERMGEDGLPPAIPTPSV